MSVTTPTLLPRPLIFPTLLPRPPQPHPIPLPRGGRYTGRMNLMRDLVQEMDDLSDEEGELEDIRAEINNRGYTFLVPIGKTTTQHEEKNDADEGSDGELGSRDGGHSSPAPSEEEDEGSSSDHDEDEDDEDDEEGRDLDADMEDLDQSVAASESRDLDQSIDPDQSMDPDLSASSSRYQEGGSMDHDHDQEFLEGMGSVEVSGEVGEEDVEFEESSLMEGSSGFRDESRDELEGDDPSFD